MARRTPLPNDLGLGSKIGFGRNMNKDGTYHIVRLGDPVFRPYELFHQLLTMRWTFFFLILIAGFLLANVFFALIYTGLGVSNLTGIEQGLDPMRQFLEAFFFSTQTLTTLGYGRVAPTGIATSVVAAVESMLGLFTFALATGLLYGRFSRPVAKVVYSRKALVAPYRGGQGLMFRLANKRRNQLIEVEVEVTLAYYDPRTKRRSFATLPLERTKVSLFPLSWTVVHPLTPKSPLYGRSAQDVRGMGIELIVLVKAFDDTFSQTIYSRTSYTSEEIAFGEKFKPMFHITPDGTARLDLRLIDGSEPAPVPKAPRVRA